MNDLRDLVRPVGAKGIAFEDKAYSGVFNESGKICLCSFGVMTPATASAAIYRDGKAREEKGIGCFCADPKIPSTPPGSAYAGSGYSAGHLWPARYGMYDPSGDVLASTFYTRNVAPQTQALNIGPWLAVETAEFNVCSKQGRTIVGCFGTIAGNTKTKSGLVIPTHFWKVIAEPESEHLVCYIMPNVAAPAPHPIGYSVPLSEITKQTGLSFPLLASYVSLPSMLYVSCM